MQLERSRIVLSNKVLQNIWLGEQRANRMDALERVLRIRPSRFPGCWSLSEFRQAKMEGYRRWRETCEGMGIEYTYSTMH